MYLDAAKKQEIFGKYGKSNTDTGCWCKNESKKERLCDRSPWFGRSQEKG